MKPLTPPELNRLLAGRDRLTQADKDAVLDRVLDALPAEVQDEPGRSHWAWLRWAVPVAAAILLGPGYFLLVRPDPQFTARGAGAAPSFEVVCAATQATGRCAPGGKLLFKVDGQGAQRFAAVARGPGGAVVWYFTDSEIGTLSAGGLLPIGVPLGPEHVPGEWEVWGFFSASVQTKDALRPALEGGPIAGVQVVRRSLEIAP